MPASPAPDDEFKTEMQQLLQGFGRKARAMRESLGVSQEDFAREIGVHRTEIGAIERGAREPRLSMLLVLADGLGVEPGELVDGLSAPVHRRPRTR